MRGRTVIYIMDGGRAVSTEGNESLAKPLPWLRSSSEFIPGFTFAPILSIHFVLLMTTWVSVLGTSFAVDATSFAVDATTLLVQRRSQSE